MKKFKLSNKTTNFWISYADLMAGLLFVFILTLGAIVIRYQYVQNEIIATKKIVEEEKNKVKKIKEQMKSSKEQIEKIVGIKTELISKIKSTLGDEVEIDPNSGALRFSGDILFEQGQSILRDEAQRTLLSVIDKINKLFIVEKIFQKHIDRIIIEGHTNSEGTYLYNLKLSQDRAFSVMKFFLEQNQIKLKAIRKYFVATGRSKSELIYSDEGKEDLVKSRRIEIKFRLKDDETIKTIGRMLNES